MRPATVRWGATGARGQAQHGVDADDALVRANGKAAKGYVPDVGTRPQARSTTPTIDRTATLQERVNRRTWRATTRDGLFLLAGERGWVQIDLGLVATIRLGPGAEHSTVRTFVADDGSLYGVALVGEIACYAML